MDDSMKKTSECNQRGENYQGSFGIESRAPGKFDQSDDYRT